MTSRRAFFGAVAAVPLLDRLSTGHSADFAALRGKAVAQLTGGELDPRDPVFAAPLARLDAAARAQRAAMSLATGRTFLWPDLPLTGVSGDIAGSYQRLRTLAVAWASRGSSLYGDETLAGEILAGLDFLYERAYNEGKRETGNWYHWEIGAPRALMDTCVLMHETISAERRAAWIRVVDRFCPDPDRRTNLTGFAETGANRADKALIVALRGIAGESPDKIALARDGLSDTRDAGKNTLFGYVTSGDGYYADGSFIQHDVVAYTGSYGVVLLQSVSAILGLLGATPWEVTDPAVRVVLDAVERTYAPWIHDGLMMDSVRGRAVSRQFNRDHDAGRDTVDAILRLAAGAGEPYAARFRELAKGWIERGRFLDTADVAATARAVAVLGDAAVAAAPRPSGHHVFAAMDRVVHRRPGWSFALSLSSKRIAMYECGNGENYRAWYQGDGATYLHLDLDHYHAGYWPTVNSYRLAGTTVDTRPRDPAVSVSGTGTFRPRNAWAGGATVGGYGVAGLDLMAVDTTLTARKSWVCLDDAVVCLGAGITGSDGRTVETVVENRATAAPLTVGDGWAHLEGVAGYVFPSGAAPRSLTERRTDTWLAINDGPSTKGTGDPVTCDYTTLWIDHGVNPVEAGYAYILLPAATARQTRDFDRVAILANTASAQAVRAHGRSAGGGEVFAATFWAAGEAGGVSASAPCAVLVRRAAGRITVAVSDPGRTVTTVTLALGHPAHRLIRADDTVSVSTGETPTVTVNLAGSRGRTHTAELAVGQKG
ncbi:polysaccharide lyase 8 family protein [Nonomuraea zeae]|uniref:Polysaccharide lyase 8 family protein n=1 Tax=Nonomuraea zeae TaxID=1642303 RepID=A0A5S4GZN9_9ACTN|nr:polysaccharide lyase 8 family protein [Nonomuraea zeae]TMR38259.1 polysaccharide lyase 8 family protein [Nonomuraea zeae]